MKFIYCLFSLCLPILAQPETGDWHEAEPNLWVRYEGELVRTKGYGVEALLHALESLEFYRLELNDKLNNKKLSTIDERSINDEIAKVEAEMVILGERIAIESENISGELFMNQQSDPFACIFSSGRASADVNVIHSTKSVRLDSEAELQSWWQYGPAGEGYDSGSVTSFAALNSGYSRSDFETQLIPKWDHGVTNASAHVSITKLGMPVNVYGYGRVSVECRVTGSWTYCETLNGIIY